MGRSLSNKDRLLPLFFHKSVFFFLFSYFLITLSYKDKLITNYKDKQYINYRDKHIITTFKLQR